MIVLFSSCCCFLSVLRFSSFVEVFHSLCFRVFLRLCIKTKLLFRSLFYHNDNRRWLRKVFLWFGPHTKSGKYISMVFVCMIPVMKRFSSYEILVLSFLLLKLFKWARFSSITSVAFCVFAFKFGDQLEYSQSDRCGKTFCAHFLHWLKLKGFGTICLNKVKLAKSKYCRKATNFHFIFIFD